MHRVVFFIGTQNEELSCGIFAAQLDETSGALSSLGPQAEVARPTWLLADPDRSILYSVSELGNRGDREGEVLSFAVEGSTLRPINRTGSCGGGPTHLDLDRAGQTLFVANFGGGQVTTIPIASDGALATATSVQVNAGSGPHRRQTGPHAHGVTLDPTQRFLLVPDMGADRIFIHRYDAASQSLAPANVPPVALPAGAGPRLLLFGPGSRAAYLLTELSAELFVYRWDDRTGALHAIQNVALDAPDAPGDRSAAALVMSPDGRFLYASNRTTNAIQTYRIDRRGGKLTWVQTIPADGAKPWSAAISPSGRWFVLANQGSDNVRSFRIDRRSGALSPVETSLAIPTPTCIVFPAAG
jgi:6-phosphogluconolactonase